jgi:hypothetical protein
MSSTKILLAMLSLALFLAFPLVGAAEDDDDDGQPLQPLAFPLVGAAEDDDDGQPLDLSTTFHAKFEDPTFGVCKVQKDVEVTFCGNNNNGLPDDDDGMSNDDDGMSNNDDDDGGPIPNLCTACEDNQFEYIYQVTARTNNAGTSLPITDFFIPVPSTDVIKAGFVQGLGAVAPSATNVDAGQVRWDFAAPNILPGQTSEDLFICSFKGPDFDQATVTCQFGIDTGDPTAPDNCLGPLVDCSMPPGVNGLGEDDDDGVGEDDDGTSDNDDDDDGGGFNPSCPTGPFANMGTPDDDDN